MRDLKHMLYTDGRGEIAIIFPKMKSPQMLTFLISNKNNELEYEMKDVFPSMEPGHFNDYWHIPITKRIMEVLDAKHKFDLVYEQKK